MNTKEAKLASFSSQPQLPSLRDLASARQVILVKDESPCQDLYLMKCQNTVIRGPHANGAWIKVRQEAAPLS